jgi:glycosyltransferase involved in cell wall biosynthesis
MKILVIKPMTNGFYKDDTTMFCEGLTKLGHEIIISQSFFANGQIYIKEDITDDILKTIDIAWAPYEPLIPVIIYLKEKFPNIKTVGHFELIPPGKLNLESINESYINKDALPDNDLTRTYYDYKLYMRTWMRCDYRTYVSDSMLIEMERLLGEKIPRERMSIKPYPLDTEMLDGYKKEDVKTKRQIITIARLVRHKKIHHIIKALSLLVNPPELVILGDGPQLENLKSYAQELGVSVTFKGIVTDEEKVKNIQESMFNVSPWAWLSVTEAAYFKKPSIVYYFPESDTRLADSAYYVENNNIRKLATAIELYFNNEEMIKNAGEHAYEMLMNDKLPTMKLEKACKAIENVFIEALK